MGGTINQKSKNMTFNEIRKMVENGTNFTVNLQKRTLRLNGGIIEINDPQSVIMRDAIQYGCFFSDLEYIYNLYKHSVPSERSNSHKRNYFRALREKELSNDDMLYGYPRELMRFDLETYVLCAITYANLTWNEEWGKWFWQSENDKDLVLLREWIEPKA